MPQPRPRAQDTPEQSPTSTGSAPGAAEGISPAATTTVGASAAVTSAATGAAVALTSKAVLETGRVLAILGGMRRFFTRKNEDEIPYIASVLTARYPGIPQAQVDSIVRQEMDREVVFQRRALARAERDLTQAAGITDERQRNAKIKMILERERRYVEQHQKALTDRVLAHKERMQLREISPRGAWWLMSPHVKEHTLDAVGPDVLVAGPQVLGAARRPYAGKLIEIVVSSGEVLTVSPKHPVLTERGWVNGEDINAGDNLFRDSGGVQRHGLRAPEDVDDVNTAEQVFKALDEAASSLSTRHRVEPLDFHGDVAGGEEVHVVGAYGSLEYGRKLAHRLRQRGLLRGDPSLAGSAPDGHSFAPLYGEADSSPRGTRATASLRESVEFIRGKARVGKAHGLATATADRDPGVEKLHLERLARASNLTGELIEGLSGEVTLDEVIEVRDVEFRGHVYDIETDGGWYTANGLIVSNCMAMGASFWPWAVLDTIHPPLHSGCPCALLGEDEAKDEGLLPPDFNPEPEGSALYRARQAIESARKQMLQEAEYSEVLHPRGRGGKWIARMWHGTNERGAKGIAKEGLKGSHGDTAVWATSSRKDAADYSTGRAGAKTPIVMPVDVTLDRPFVVDYRTAPLNAGTSQAWKDAVAGAGINPDARFPDPDAFWTDRLREQGYDGVVSIYPPRPTHPDGDMTVVEAFDPAKVKLVTPQTVSRTSTGLPSWQTPTHPLDSRARGPRKSTGYPDLDQAINEFTGLPDPASGVPDFPIDNFRDPTTAWGSCEEVADALAAFLKKRGYNAYSTADELTMFPGYEDAKRSEDIGAGDFTYPEHAMVEIYDLPGMGVNTITVDFTAAQYGYGDFPKIEGVMHFDPAKSSGKYTALGSQTVSRTTTGKQISFTISTGKPKISRTTTGPPTDKITGPPAADHPLPGGDWLVGGGCVALAIALQAMKPDLKIATGWYDDHGRKAIAHSIAYDPATNEGYDGFGVHPHWEEALWGYSPLTSTDADSDPQALADQMEMTAFGGSYDVRGEPFANNEVMDATEWASRIFHIPGVEPYEDLQEARGAYDPVLHPRDRIGKWIRTVRVPRSTSGPRANVIAIDGPSASGKSTIAKKLATDIGARYVDTGAMFRVAGLASLQGQDPVTALRDANVEGSHVYLHGQDVTEQIRAHEVDMAAAKVGQNDRVRAAVKLRIEKIVDEPGVSVVEGRDTAEALNAGKRIYLTASLEDRAARRAADRGQEVGMVQDAIARRDAVDSANLANAKANADIVVDTTGMDLEQGINATVNALAASLPGEESKPSPHVSADPQGAFYRPPGWDDLYANGQPKAKPGERTDYDAPKDPRWVAADQALHAKVDAGEPLTPGDFLYRATGKGDCFGSAKLLARDFPGVFTVVAGRYQNDVVRVGPPVRNHAWVTMRDGTILDTTHAQFNGDYPVVIVRPGSPLWSNYTPVTGWSRREQIELGHGQAIAATTTGVPVRGGIPPEAIVPTEFKVNVRHSTTGDPMNPAGHRIEARDANGRLMGVLAFTRTEDPEDYMVSRKVITSLEVNPEIRRRGVAQQMVREMDRLFPGETDPGEFTPDGAKFWSATTGTDVKPSQRFARQRSPSEWWEGAQWGENGPPAPVSVGRQSVARTSTASQREHLSIQDVAYVAEGVMARGGLTGRKWDIPVGKMPDPQGHGDIALGTYGPKAKEASAWASEVAGFPVTVVASTWWPEGDTVQASAQAATRTITVRPQTDDLTILHEIAHLIRDGGTDGPPTQHGHDEDWAIITRDLYAKHLGAEAGQVFSRIVWPDEQRIAMTTVGVDALAEPYRSDIKARIAARVKAAKDTGILPFDKNVTEEEAIGPVRGGMDDGFLEYVENKAVYDATMPRVMYHLTDNPNFTLDPTIAPFVNTTMGDMGANRKGLYVASDPERWFNGYDYVRPFVAEVEVPPLGEYGGYSGENFLPAEQFANATVQRVIPWDEYVRERYGEYGHFEAHRDPSLRRSGGLDAPIPRPPEGYRYEGPDARDMTPEQARYYKELADEYIWDVRAPSLTAPGQSFAMTTTGAGGVTAKAAKGPPKMEAGIPGEHMDAAPVGAQGILPFPGRLELPQTEEQALKDSPAGKEFPDLYAAKVGDQKLYVGVDTEGDMFVIEDPYDPEFDASFSSDAKPAIQWLYDLSDSELERMYPSPDPWEEIPETGWQMFHGTDRENLDSILADGMVAQQKTGIPGEPMWPGVWVTDNYQTAVDYATGMREVGPVVAIDLGAMKRDGYMPALEREPGIRSGEQRESAAAALGVEGFYDDSASQNGVEPDTLIIRDSVPAKYVSVMGMGADDHQEIALTTTKTMGRPKGTTAGMVRASAAKADATPDASHAVLAGVADKVYAARETPGYGKLITSLTPEHGKQPEMRDGLKSMLEERAAAFNMTVPEYEETVRQHLRKLLDSDGRRMDTYVAVRMWSGNLLDFLENGYRNAHDPHHKTHDGSPKREGYIEERAEWESRVFGDHPIYGYMANDREKVGEASVSGFGDVKLALKPVTSWRTTFTYSDSNYVPTRNYQVLPSPVNDPDPASVYPGLEILQDKTVCFDGTKGDPLPPLSSIRSPGKRESMEKWQERIGRMTGDDKTWAEIEFKRERVRLAEEADSYWSEYASGDFYEAQIHGGLTVDDVDHIVLTRPATATEKAALDKAGVSYQEQVPGQQIARTTMGAPTAVDLPPKPEFPSIPGMGIDELMAQPGWEETSARYYEKERQWKRLMLRAVATGKITLEEAEKRGYFAQRGKYEPLPDHLYHVTTARDGVLASGLLTREELGQNNGAGLGGGTDDTISFTTDPKIADDIKAAVLEAASVARGDYSVAQMIEDARAGKGTDRPYLQDVIRSWGGAPKWVEGDPLPPGLQSMLDGTRPERVRVTPLEMSEILGVPWPDAHDYEPNPGELAATGWQIDRPGHDLPNGGRVSAEITRPRDYRDDADDWMRFYKAIAAFRQEAGGSMDPLFFSQDSGALARMDPGQVAVVEVEPVDPSYRGYQVSALGEWRTNFGDLTRIIGVDGQPYVEESASVPEAPQIEEAKIDPLHPRDRRGRWIEKLGKLKQGDRPLTGDYSGIAVTRDDEGAFVVHNGGAMMGFPMPVQTSDPVEVADLLAYPPVPDGKEGTLADPAVLQEMVGSFKWEDAGAAITSIRRYRGSTVTVNGLLTRKEQGVLGGWQIRFTPVGEHWKAYHDEIVAPTGGGAGSHFMRHMEEEYARRDITEIHLTAAMSRGGYVWAREGFRFDTGRSDNEGASERGQALSLLQSRAWEWAPKYDDPEYPDEHVSLEQAAEFMSHFAGTTEFDGESLESMLYGEGDEWDREVVAGLGGPYFQTPQEIAMYGIENAWEEADPRTGETYRNWIGKDFLMGAKWEGVKRIDPAVMEEAAAGTSDLPELVARMNLAYPPWQVDDYTFWMKVREHLMSLSEGWREFLHPRGRGGLFVRTADLPKTPWDPNLDGGWLKGLSGFSHRGITATVERSEVKGAYGRVTLALSKDGERVGLAQFRVLPPDRESIRRAKIDNLYLRPDARGDGATDALLGEFYAHCRENDVDLVQLEAIDVGGYFWASEGYSWVKPAGIEQQRILWAAKSDGRWDKIVAHDPEGAAELEALINAGTFESEAHMAMFGRKRTWEEDGHLWWPGKALLAGARWDGERAP